MIGSANTLRLPESAWTQDESPLNFCRRLVLEQYDRENVSLLRYLVSIGAACEQAEELVQESFLRLHQHLLNGGDRTNLRAWLYRVAHNLTRNTQVAPASNRTGSLSLVIGDAEPRSGGSSVEATLLERERNRQLSQALARLDAVQKSCLLLRSQGLKYREIAEIHDLSISTVAEHVRRGLENLKESL